MLTATTALALWAFLRALEEEEAHPGRWALVWPICLGAGLLLKSLVGALFPIAAALIYLALTRQLPIARTWNRLRPFSGTAIVVLIAAPWHILATIQNPPWFDFTMRSAPGEYHGFLWFFFINEQLLRFLNMRYPTRLQHGSARLLLAVPSSVVISMERLSAGGRQALFQAGGPDRPRAFAVTVLDRFRAGLLHFLNDAGVLLDAVLSGVCVADRVGDGGGKHLDSQRHERADRDRGAGGSDLFRTVGLGARTCYAGRHCDRAQSAAGNLYAFAGAHWRTCASRHSLTYERLCWPRPLLSYSEPWDCFGHPRAGHSLRQRR